MPCLQQDTLQSTTNLCDDVLVLALPPCISGMSHHGHHCVVVFLVLVIQEHQFGPEMGLFRGPEYLGEDGDVTAAMFASEAW